MSSLARGCGILLLCEGCSQSPALWGLRLLEGESC